MMLTLKNQVRIPSKNTARVNRYQRTMVAVWKLIGIEDRKENMGRIIIGARLRTIVKSTQERFVTGWRLKRSITSSPFVWFSKCVFLGKWAKAARGFLVGVWSVTSFSSLVDTYKSGIVRSSLYTETGVCSKMWYKLSPLDIVEGADNLDIGRGAKVEETLKLFSRECFLASVPRNWNTVCFPDTCIPVWNGDIRNIIVGRYASWREFLSNPRSIPGVCPVWIWFIWLG